MTRINEETPSPSHAVMKDSNDEEKIKRFIDRINNKVIVEKRLDRWLIFIYVLENDIIFKEIIVTIIENIREYLSI